MNLYIAKNKIPYYNKEKVFYGGAYLKVTIQDVAQKAGVSITTVSRVLNNNYPVKEETRKKVEAVIHDLNFVPNSLARGLIKNKTNTIGVLVPSITNLFFPNVINGIEHYMEEKGYTFILCDTRERNSELLQLKTLTERKVDGIISIDPSTKLIKSGVYEELSKEVPLVIVNGYNENIRCNFVINNQQMGTVEALEYLISLGHKKIAFLRGKKSYSYDLKEEIYYKVLKENNIRLNKDYIIVIDSGNSIETVDMSMRIVESRLKNNNKPTAIFACNDWMAAGALNACQKLNIDVPKDISIIGYDNTIICELSEPKLTSVDQNMYRLGKSAGQLLYENIEDRVVNKKVVLDTNLIKRESCAENSL